MEHKKYDKILRAGSEEASEVLANAKFVYIFEKLDGANASFRLSEDGTEVLAYSRNCLLTESNDLRGFYQWVKENIKPSDLKKDHIYFGEWLVKHKIDYGTNQNSFYLFDIYYDYKSISCYLPFNSVIHQANELNLQIVPLFYAGPYRGYEHLSSFVGKSVLSATGIGEGIVVKEFSYLDKDSKQVYIKMVSEAFAEIKTKKEKTSSNIQELPEYAYLDTNLTEARVHKIICKLVDEGIIPEKYSLSDMSLILQKTSKELYEDIIEEEPPHTDLSHKEIKRLIGRIIPAVVKKIILGDK